MAAAGACWREPEPRALPRPHIDQKGSVLAYNLRHPQPSAPPLPWGKAPAWPGASMAAPVVEAEEAVDRALRLAEHAGGNVQIMLVNNLHVHLHQHSSGGHGSTTSNQEVIDGQSTPAAQLQHFHPNDPDFHPCTYSPQGVDFGYKVVSRGYKAQKLVHPQYNMITYSQCPSAAQAASHALTLHLSHKRSKNALFLFDCSLELASNSWPSIIYFTRIKSLIAQLGPAYEYHRRKVRGRRFSLYFYVVKSIGVRFSGSGRQTLSSLFEWAHSLRDSVDNGGSAPSGSQVIAQVAAIGVTVLGAL